MKKTIKVIDLLNMIANKEELPKKIKWRNTIYVLKKESSFINYEPTFENGSWLLTINILSNASKYFFKVFLLID